jgi:hypothetical protein
VIALYTLFPFGKLGFAAPAALSFLSTGINNFKKSASYLPIHLQTLAMPATTAETLSLVTRNVSVAPLVLLSAADHYGRSAKGTRKRVVGVLLGQNDGKNVRVSNSFAGMRSPITLLFWDFIRPSNTLRIRC